MFRRFRLALVAAVSVAPAIGASVPHTSAAAPTYYLALGDSLARGTGAASGAGYVDKVFAFEKQTVADLQLVNLSCGGATTSSMINGGGCAYTTGSQLGDAEAFLAAHPGQVAFVTIDIGGNDGLGCGFAIPLDKHCVKNLLPSIKANLTTILTRLRAAGGTVPIVGMTYYDPLLAHWLQGGEGQTAARDSVRLVKMLNGALKGVYRKHKGGIADGEKKFLVSKFARKGLWAGQTVPVNVAETCNWTHMCTSGDIHANDAGHAALAEAFEPAVAKLLAKR